MTEPPPTLSPFVTGDPIVLGAGVTSITGVLAAAGLGGLERPGVLLAAPGVALVHDLAAGAGALAIRWVRLPHRPVLHPALGPTDTAVVVTAPLRESGHAVRVVARLLAVLREPTLLPAARPVTTREALVRVLAAAEPAAGEAVLSEAEVLALLGTTPAGLPAPEGVRRLRVCGPNRLERIARRALTLRLLEQFSSFFAWLLWIAGACALLAGMAELGWAIFAVIAVNGTFSFLQEYRAERALDALQDLLPHTIAVVRDGVGLRVPTADVVPGDVVRVEEGDQVPADGQLLAAEALRIDQSALTGESHPVFKMPARADERARVPRQERHELVFAGTGVVAGSGTFVVTATGMATAIGAIAHLTQSVAEEPSPLQGEMTAVTRLVTLLAVTFGAGFFALGVATGVVSVAQGFLFALGVIVANVPEGLLPTLTLALALGARRMARERSLMKRLSVVEALGATTVVCCDKTGTLTENRMTARHVWAAGRTWAVDDLGRESPREVRDLLEAATLASQATLAHGDPTEVGLVAAAAAAGLVPEVVRDGHTLLAPYPFDSFRKRMTLVRRDGGRVRAYVKGAPRETLGLCDTIRRGDAAVPLTDAVRDGVLAEHDRLAAGGLRLIAIAVRDLAEPLVGAPAGAVERELTFLGLVALWDPPRPEVAGAIALCRRAGIRVVMITGDYGLTAGAIARQIGLPVEKVVAGEEIGRLSPAAFRRLLAEPGVLFARASPAHKLAIVTELKGLGEVVAVTGDGVNDAPALRAAQIGVAMGRRGSDVAKEAADMVITDDDFTSLVAAIRQGRAIYANMGKFVTYIFASNVPELLPFLASVFLGLPLPLTVMQILAVDLGTDVLPALALGAEAPEPGVMDRPPRRRSERLLGTARLLHAYAFLGVLEAALAMSAFLWTYWLAGWRPGLPMAAAGDLYRRATTMTLGGIVACQVGNVFACRTDRESVLRVGLLGNRLVLAGIAAEVALLLALMLVPPLPRVFGLAPLGVGEWGLLLLFPPALLAAEETRKWALRRRGR